MKCRLLALLSLALCQALAAQPNVLFIAVDDLRPEFGAYGSHVQSPNLDRLAESGQLFERAYCNVPVCGASRASLLTGMRPGRFRFPDYSTMAEEHAPDAIPLPAAFQNAGYRTFAYGKVFHHPEDFSEAWDEIHVPRGLNDWRDYLSPENVELDALPGKTGPAYEIYEGEEKYIDERIADLTIATLEELNTSGEPFFIAAGFVKPHLPFNAPKAFWDLYDPESIELPSTYERIPGIPDVAYHDLGELRQYSGVPKDTILPEDDIKTLIRGYYASTSYVDSQIGRVLDRLDELDLRDNTIVVLWGDHGYNLGEHTLWSKQANFDHALRVPLLIDAPGLPEGVRQEGLVEFVDLYPTLMELTGLEAPEGQLEGSSLVPRLKNPAAPGKPFIIAKYHDGISIRTDEGWLFTEWQNWRTGKPYEWMLFNLEDDPDETVNLAAAEEHADLIEELKGLLYANWGEDFEKRIVW